MKCIIHTDGGARGNPGPAAVGAVIEEAISGQLSADSQNNIENKTLKAESRKLIAEFGKRIGETTNNVAEYTAVLEALKEVRSQKAKGKNEDQELTIEIQFFLDSKLVVEQLSGNFKVKDAKLRELMLQVKMLEGEIGGAVSYQYVPREENRRADFLVNKALDSNTSNPSYLVT